MNTLGDVSLPCRHQLPHDVPSWGRPDDAVYFVTICCQPRGQNQLARKTVAARVFETVAFRNQHQVWYAHVFLLMSDHAHALLSFPTPRKPMKTIVAEWKAWTAKQLGIAWQRDFFEHRLRCDESFRDKIEYILHNPVRAGLVSAAKDWPYVWFPDR